MFVRKARARYKLMAAFLRGPAASHFYAIPADDRKTYKDTVKMLFGAMYHTAQRENFYAEFEVRTLRPGEDPAVYKGGLTTNVLQFATTTATSKICSQLQLLLLLNKSSSLLITATA